MIKWYLYLLLLYPLILTTLTPEEETIVKKIQDTTVGELTSLNPSDYKESFAKVESFLENAPNKEERKLLVPVYQALFIKNIILILFKSALTALLQEKEYISFQELWQEGSYDFLQSTYGFLDDGERANLNLRIMKTATFFDTYFNLENPSFTLINSNKALKNEKDFNQLFFFYISLILNTALLVVNYDFFPLLFVQETLKTMREKLEKISKDLLKPEAYEKFVTAKIKSTNFNLIEFLKHCENNPTQEIPLAISVNDIYDLSDDLIFLLGTL